MQLSMLNFLYSRNMLSKNEDEKIKNKLRIKYTKQQTFLFERGNIESKGEISVMKTNNVEIIKADSLVRRRGVNVERH